MAFNESSEDFFDELERRFPKFMFYLRSSFKIYNEEHTEPLLSVDDYTQIYVFLPPDDIIDLYLGSRYLSDYQEKEARLVLNAWRIFRDSTYLLDADEKITSGEITMVSGTTFDFNMTPDEIDDIEVTLESSTGLDDDGLFQVTCLSIRGMLMSTETSLLAASMPIRTESYQTMQNNGKFFTIFATQTSGHLPPFIQIGWKAGFRYNDALPNKLASAINPLVPDQYFAGYDDRSRREGPNSALLLVENEVMVITGDIEQFNYPNDGSKDPTVAYYNSNVGNSGVPYPVIYFANGDIIAYVGDYVFIKAEDVPAEFSGRNRPTVEQEYRLTEMVFNDQVPHEELDSRLEVRWFNDRRFFSFWS